MELPSWVSLKLLGGGTAPPVGGTGPTGGPCFGHSRDSSTPLVMNYLFYVVDIPRSCYIRASW